MIMGFLKNIPDKERRLIIPAGIAIVLLSVLLFADFPLYKKGKEMERKAMEEEKRLNSIIYMGSDYLSMKNEMDDLMERAFNGEGSSLAGLESIVGRSGLKKKPSSLKPATTALNNGMKRVRAELSFERVPIGDLARLINAVELDGHAMTVERAAIKATYDNPSLYNATLIVNTVERD